MGACQIETEPAVVVLPSVWRQTFERSFSHVFDEAHDPNDPAEWDEVFTAEGVSQSNNSLGRKYPHIDWMPLGLFSEAVELTLHHSPFLFKQVENWCFDGADAVAQGSCNLELSGFTYTRDTITYTINAEGDYLIETTEHIVNSPSGGVSLGLAGIAVYDGQLQTQIICVKGAGGTTAEDGKAVKVDITDLIKTALDRANDFVAFELLPIPPIDVDISGTSFLDGARGLLNAFVQKSISYEWRELNARWFPIGSVTTHKYYWDSIGLSGMFASLNLDAISLGDNDRVDGWLPSQMPV
jgi:hypothetical protein